MDRLYSQVYNYIFPYDSLECSQHFVHNHKDQHISHFYKLMSCGSLYLLNILVFYTYHKDFLCDLANRYISDDDFWYYIPHLARIFRMGKGLGIPYWCKLVSMDILNRFCIQLIIVKNFHS